MNGLEVYKQAEKVLKKGENIALVTVISTTGSTPGKVAYKMLVWGKNGKTIGTVGGGLIEANMIDIAENILPKIENQVFRFDLDDVQDNGKGICGGSIELLIETFDKKSLPLFKELSTVIENGDSSALISIISPGKSPKKIFLKSAEQADIANDVSFPPEICESIKQLAAKEQSAKQPLENGTEIFVETIPEQPMLFIFGAGHLSYYISRYARSLNFRVTICDDRAEFANRKRFPDATNIIVEDFEMVFDKIDISKNSYVVIVTRGHKSDELVLGKAVKTDAKYIGMVGSKTKTSTILKSLHKKGTPQEALRKVYSPIGISIGAVTPQEIALSIVSELIKVRRLGDAPETKHMSIYFSKSLQEEL